MHPYCYTISGRPRALFSRPLALHNHQIHFLVFHTSTSLSLSPLRGLVVPPREKEKKCETDSLSERHVRPPDTSRPRHVHDAHKHMRYELPRPAAAAAATATASQHPPMSPTGPRFCAPGCDPIPMWYYHPRKGPPGEGNQGGRGNGPVVQQQQP